MNVTRGQWVTAFLTRCKYPQTSSNVLGVLTWIRAEWSSSTPIPARYNPLSTTVKHEGSTDFNDVGVQNFLTAEDGIDTTAATLLAGDYAEIRLQLSRGDDDKALIVAIGASRWGSKPNGSFLTYTTQHRSAEEALAIGAATAPTLQVVENDMIVCPNKPAVNGRQPFAVLDVANRRVLLFNGASLAAGIFLDFALGNYRVWPVPTTVDLLGMDATRDPNNHLYDNRGVVVSAVDGGTFEAHWR